MALVYTWTQVSVTLLGLVKVWGIEEMLIYAHIPSLPVGLCSCGDLCTSFLDTKIHKQHSQNNPQVHKTWSYSLTMFQSQGTFIQAYGSRQSKKGNTCTYSIYAIYTRTKGPRITSFYTWKECMYTRHLFSCTHPISSTHLKQNSEFEGLFIFNLLYMLFL